MNGHRGQVHVEALVHAYHAHDEAVPCVHCGEPIVLVPEVGWTTLDSGDDCYDMCEGDPFANHAPPGAVRRIGG